MLVQAGDIGSQLPSLVLSLASIGPSRSGTDLGVIGYAPPKRGRQSLIVCDLDSSPSTNSVLILTSNAPQAQIGAEKVYLLLDGLNLVHVLSFWPSYSYEDSERKESVECVCISEQTDTSELLVSGWVAKAATLSFLAEQE